MNNLRCTSCATVMCHKEKCRCSCHKTGLVRIED